MAKRKKQVKKYKKQTEIKIDSVNSIDLNMSENRMMIARLGTLISMSPHPLVDITKLTK